MTPEQQQIPEAEVERGRAVMICTNYIVSKNAAGQRLQWVWWGDSTVRVNVVSTLFFL